MSMSISSASGMSSMMMQGGGRMQRPDPAKMAEDLFAQLDTSGKGYIEVADLKRAMESASSTSTSSEELFASLDSDSDGKVTQQEMSDTLAKLSESLDSQFQNMRMNEAMSGQGGMPPPPPPENDVGFTKEELTSQLAEIGSTDSQRASLISNVINNFEAADTDSDGKVSFQEAMALDKSSATTASSASTSNAASSDSNSANQNSDAKLMLQIMKLMQTYADFGDISSSSLSTLA